MKVTVAYVGAAGTALEEVDLPDGAVVAEAVDASGVVGRLGLVPAALGLAVHGQLAKPGTPLRDGDRVELLESLRVDPKVARQLRARAKPLPRRVPAPRARARREV
jgi:putative ubiquitin-RnfH superfamily antitoxin RatB of RatAB toxin-antitoxin module